MQIESLQNPRIKNLLKLQQKSRERRKQKLLVVEGIQENELALKNGFEAKELFVCEELFESAFFLDSKIKQFTVSSSLFNKIAYRGTTGGIIGIYYTRENRLTEIKLPENPLIVIMETVEKPGNLGAVLRTCDAAGVDLVVVCEPLTDWYNPNIIRSSVGTVFTNLLVSEEKEKLLSWLKKNEIQILATYLHEKTESLYKIDFRKKSALILGTEATGISKFWVENSDRLIKIPMKGQIDSLNISNAAAICIYEAVRQREK